MRRFIGCTLVLLAAISSPGQTQSDPNAAEARREVTEIRHAADKLIATGNPEDAAKAAALLEKASEIDQVQSNAEKMAIEREKLRQDLEESQRIHWKEIVASLVPLLSTIVLAGTLIFQIRQARIAESQKRDENSAQAKRNEQQRFMDALKDIQTNEKISTSAALINTFKDDPYKTQALDMAVKLLLMRDNFDDFQTLFMAVLNPLTYDKMPQMSRLCRAVDTSYFSIATPIWDEATGQNDTSKLTPHKRKAYELYDQEQLFLSEKLAGLLVTPPPADTSLDLAQLNLRNMDLSGVDLGAANITGTNWNFVNIDGCDLSRITRFENLQMYATAWWHAAKISQPLLAWLTKKNPHSPIVTGYNTRKEVSADEYKSNVARLQAGGSEIGATLNQGRTPESATQPA